MGLCKNIKFDRKVFFNKKISIIVSCILIIGVAGIVYITKNNKVKAKEVTIDKVLMTSISETNTATGNIEPKYRSNIAINSSQKVLKINVEEGQAVKKGDILIELDSSDYENQLAKLKINLENSKLALNQMIQTGTSAEKANAENTLNKAKYSLEDAQRNYDDLSKKYDQSKVLFDNGAISESQLDEAKKNLDAGESEVKSAEDSLENAQISFDDINNSSEVKIETQKNSIALIEKDIESCEKKISDSKITSNIDGKVIKIDVKENQFPKAGDEIIIDDASEYRVVVDLKQYDALKVEKGQKANIKIKGDKDSYTGIVKEIGEIAEAKTSASSGDDEFKVKVSVTIDEPKEEVKSGYEAEVEFIFKESNNSLAVRFDGVKDDKTTGNKYVYVVDSNNNVSRRAINTGIESEYYVEITNGLEEGDKYILNPPESLEDGDLVVEGVSGNTSANKK